MTHPLLEFYGSSASNTTHYTHQQHMRRSINFFAPLVLGISALLCDAASAAPIVGEISFSGSYTIDNSNLTLATKFLSFSNVTVSLGPTGDYAGLAGLPVTHMPFTFDPLPVGGVVPLWSVPSSPGTSFDLLTVSIDFESPNILLLTGQGIAHKAGRDNTVGSWILSANTLGTTFSFSSTNASPPSTRPIPEPGTVLFGIALLGVTAIRRRR